jgi:diguanylate cyclase (GGDEF)-like protein/PAS domain S-box-containing protein
MTKPLISVLLIDDDEEDAFLTGELLGDVTSLKCSVKIVHSAAAGISEIVHGTYDVCLLDYRLGGETGLDVLAAVTAQGSNLPCIMLTGQDDEEIDSAALAAGAVDYLVKGSFDGETLARTIRYALRNAEALRSLKISEQRFRSVVDSASDAILVVSDDGIVQSWNPQALQLFGRDSSGLGTLQFSQLFKAEMGDQAVTDLVAGLRRVQQIEDKQAFDLEAETPEGLLVPCEVTMASWQGTGGKQWTAIVRDVTERKAMEDRLVHQAFHDPLTKLANRSLFRNRVEHGVARLSRAATFVGVLFCDLDDFKRINDTLGHAAGDELLVAVAQRLQSCIRRTDTAARLGGDEFAILIEDANDTEDILKVAAATLRAFNQPFRVADREIVVTSSIGIAISGESDNDAEVLLRNADVAMYAAKHSGKDRYTVFEGSMHRELMYRLQLEGDLRKAVEQEEISVRYQPIVHLESMALRGFEALARWEHPTLGTISPVTFIPLAEELGLIPEIGRQVLRRSCNQLKAWQDSTGLHDLIVSVNISVLQLEDDSMHNVVARELELSGLEASKLVLEITESAMAQDPLLTSARLALVNELGVKLAIDDFGTGYSSLSYLRDLPVDILKIDRSFVNQMSDRGGAGEKLVRAIVAMAHSLGLTIVAEGVETSEQQRTLTELGCAYAQGNLFALPLLPSEALEFISTHKAAATSASV